MKNLNLSVIIPVMRLKKPKNSRYFFKSVWGIVETVDSIIHSLSGFDFEFVFVQNGDDPDLNEYLKSVLRQYKGRLVQISENVGVSKAWNIGISASQNEFLIVSNDDVEFESHSISTLLRVLTGTEKIGQVGPEGGDWYRDKSGHRRGLSDIEEVEEVSGYFFITRRSAYNYVGGFDENYSPAGVEEIDYSFNLRHNGFKCLVVPNSGIKHHGYHGVSAKSQEIHFLGTTIDTHTLDRRNKMYFVSKWYEKS